MYVYLVWKQTVFGEEVLYIYRDREKAKYCKERCVEYAAKHNTQTFYSIQEREVML